MNIKELTEKLETEINTKMEQLAKLGKKAKEQQRKLDSTYKEMSIIAQELDPVTYIIKQKHPKHAELLTLLKKEHNE